MPYLGVPLMVMTPSVINAFDLAIQFYLLISSVFLILKYVSALDYFLIFELIPSSSIYFFEKMSYCASTWINGNEDRKGETGART